MATGTTTGALFEVAGRIRALRGEAGYSIPRMAELTGLDEETYRMYEAGETDLPFTFIHKCAQIFKVEIVELMEGSSARLSRYAVTRRGKGELTAHEPGIALAVLVGAVAVGLVGKAREEDVVAYPIAEEGSLEADVMRSVVASQVYLRTLLRP